jgi:hypothetical protein
MSLGRMTKDLAGDASIKDLKRARIGIDRHTERLRHVVGSPWVGPIPPVVKTYV